MSASEVAVVGSLHADLIAYADQFPAPGLSSVGTRFVLGPGGKATNQAGQLATLGVPVKLIARVGDDAMGRSILNDVRRRNVDCSLVFVDSAAVTGASTVFAVNGEYQSIIVPGASVAFSAEDIAFAIKSISHARFVIGQLEIPTHVTAEVFRAAGSSGAIRVLNPSPLAEASNNWIDELLHLADIVVLNRHEAERFLARTVLTQDDAVRAATEMVRLYDLRNAAITCGPNGAVLASPTQCHVADGLHVDVVDSVGAGDAFLGALVAGWVSGSGDEESLDLANHAAAWSVTRTGGFGSAGNRANFASLSGD